MNYPSDTCVLKKDSTEKIFQNKLCEDLLYDVEDNHELQEDLLYNNIEDNHNIYDVVEKGPDHLFNINDNSM